MAGVSDRELTKLAAFPAGLNTTAEPTAGPVGETGAPLALLEAVNIDLDNAGKPHRRPGHEMMVQGVAHSLHATDEHLYAVVDGTLGAYVDAPDGLELAQAIRASLGERWVSYASDDDDVYYSNGVHIGRIDASLNDRPVWLATPDPVALAATPNGSLAAGSYEVTVTAVDDDGRESGASAPVLITVATGQGIEVTLPAAPPDAVAWHIYRTTPDGEVAYLAIEALVGTATIYLGHQPLGRPLETAWLFPMPACEALCYWRGRLLGLSGNLLLWSEAYRLGLIHADHYLRVGQRATLLAPVDGGVFIADHKRTYFLAGTDPQTWQQRAVYGHAAVPGTAFTAAGHLLGLDTTAPITAWVATNGVLCLGLPDGSVRPLREGEFTLPADAEAGTLGLVEHGGIRQLLLSLRGGERAALAVGVGDSAEATIRRHGVVLP